MTKAELQRELKHSELRNSNLETQLNDALIELSDIKSRSENWSFYHSEIYGIFEKSTVTRALTIEIEKQRELIESLNSQISCFESDALIKENQELKETIVKLVQGKK